MSEAFSCGLGLPLIADDKTAPQVKELWHYLVQMTCYLNTFKRRN
jgi:hypothetical protein